MSTSTKALLITLGCSIPAFFLGNVLWPADPHMNPTNGQIPLFIILAALESLAFGAGIAYLILCWSRAQHVRSAFLASVWLLISWWPHDNMHKHNGLDMAGLLVIEYLFHVTLIVCGFIIARYFWQTLSQTQNQQHELH